MLPLQGRALFYDVSECGIFIFPNSGGNTDYIRPERFVRPGRYFLKEENQMKSELLKLLSRNARYTVEELADMMGKTENEVKQEMATLEKEGIIRGYKAVIDWEKLDAAYVSAILDGHAGNGRGRDDFA